MWRPDEQFDIEHHLRHSALPRPGRVRELLELCGRLHSTRLAWERPLWETHVIEGLRDGRVAMYSKLHHALVDGVSAMRLLQSVLSTDPDQRDMVTPVDSNLWLSFDANVDRLCTGQKCVDAHGCDLARADFKRERRVAGRSVSFTHLY